MDGRSRRKHGHLAQFEQDTFRTCRQAGCQRRLFLHRIRLPRHTPASLRQAGRQGVGTGAGHLRATAETPVCVHSIQVQGQYEDAETGLYYNRFRYYDPNAGSYISQDPIGLAGGNPTLYGYAQDTNGWIDPLGLDVFALFEINGKIFEGDKPNPKEFQE